MSKKKVLKSTMIAMLAIAFAILPALFSHTDKTVMAAVKKCETTSGSAICENEKLYLDVLGSEFTIQSSTGSYAKVKGINVVEGNLDVRFSSFEIGGTTITFEIPQLKENESYTVDLEEGTKEIVIRNRDKNNGFYCSVKAEKPLSITVDSNGAMSTHVKDGEAVRQNISYAKNTLNWVGTDIIGTDTGFKVEETDGKVQISSQNNVQIDLNLSDGINELNMDAVKTEDGIVVVSCDKKESSDKDVYIVLDSRGNEIAKKEMGFCVKFYPLNGTTIEDTKNVVSGTAITEPAQPEREGYEFAGWYTSSDCNENEKWDFSEDKVTKNTSLWAKWIEVPTKTLEPTQYPNYGSENYMAITVNYNALTVKRSDGVYAKFENGLKTEGTLDVSGMVYFNGPGAEIDASISIPKLEEGQNYTIIPETTAVEKYQTEILCSGDTGYYAKLNASDIVEMTVSYFGDVQTKTVNGEKVEQRIVAGPNDESKMPWLSTKINGTDSGFSLIYDKGKVQISSDNQVDVNILVAETYQSLEMGTVSTDSGSVSVSKEEECYVVKDATGAELVKKEMGHFVFFRTGVVDIQVPGYTNVAANTCVAAPENVTREGYELEGWYTTSTYDEGTKWDFATNTVTADTYLYAKWTEKKSETVVKDEKPKKVGNVSVKNSAKKTAKITWKKVSKATGYQVQYSTNKKFKKTATQMLNVKSNSKKITKLKKGKTYYVRVRAYVKSGNKTTYGTYSTVKKIKIKK